MSEVCVLAMVGLVATSLECESDSVVDSVPSRREVQDVRTDSERDHAETGHAAVRSRMEGPTTAPGAGAGVLPDYFPLGAGGKWKYEVVARRSGQVRTASATKEVVGAQSIGGRDYCKATTVVEPEGALGPSPPPQFYRIAEEGVYAAVQGAPGKELLVLPANPKRTMTWSGDAMPAIKGLTGQASTGETCNLGKQKYSECVKVSLTMTVLVARSFLGRLEVPVRIDRWFAPGVGLVREIRDDGASHIESKLTGYESGK